MQNVDDGNLFPLSQSNSSDASSINKIDPKKFGDVSSIKTENEEEEVSAERQLLDMIGETET